MDFIKHIYLLFDHFSDEHCCAWNGYHPDLRPNWNDEMEHEWNLIQEHSPIPLPQDYWELFCAFGGGGIDDRRSNWVMPTMTFWTWAEIQDFHNTLDFFEECPNALPFGDDIGDVVYMLIENNEEHGVYMSEKSTFWDKELRRKIANSFTELFTNPEVQRLFRNYFNYGCDKGSDGR